MKRTPDWNDSGARIPRLIRRLAAGVALIAHQRRRRTAVQTAVPVGVRQAALACLIVVGSAAAVLAAAPQYSLTEIPPSPGYDNAYPQAINNAGEVAGNQAAGGYYKEPFYWSAATGTVKIPVLGGGGYGKVFRINASGEITGNSSGIWWIWRYRAGLPPEQNLPAEVPGFANSPRPTLNWLNDLGQAVGSGVDSSLEPVGVNANGSPVYPGRGILWTRDGSGSYSQTTTLPPLPGDNVSEAIRINNNAGGVSVVGRSYFYPAGASHLVRWTYDGASWVPAELPTSIPGATGYSITVQNDNGEVAGQYSSAVSGQGAFYISNPPGGAPAMVDLGNLGNGYYTRPHGINESSQVVGTSSVTVSGKTQLRAFSWDPSRGSNNLLNLGTLGGSQSRAEGDSVWHELSWDVVNEGGAIVGYSYPKGDQAWHATVWVPGPSGSYALYDMNNSGVTPNKGALAELFGAAAINDSGWIIGYASTVAKVKGVRPYHGFLARPVGP